MEGYVYIARIIDHGGKFVNGYHKIGLSKQYKVRETQLNSTHLPFDVLMTRVFETEDMKQLEGLLHLCFEDYRVVKEYDYRRNITTEWFDVGDIDIFNDRVDKFVDLMSINELNLSDSVDNDTTMTQDEKNQTKERIGKAKASKIVLNIDGMEYKDDTQRNLMSIAYKYICDTVGHQEVADFDRLVSVDINNFRKYLDTYNPNKQLRDSSAIKDLEGSYLWTVVDAKTKVKHIKKLCERFQIENLSFEIVE